MSVSIGNFLVPKYNVPPFTLPFNFSTIVFLLASYQFSRFNINTALLSPAAVHKATEEWYYNNTAFWKSVVRGVGQVYLADDFFR
jgi:urea transporter